MKGHANWSGRVPRTTEQAFGPGEYMTDEEASSRDRPIHILIAVLLMALVGLLLAYPG